MNIATPVASLKKLQAWVAQHDSVSYAQIDEEKQCVTFGTGYFDSEDIDVHVVYTLAEARDALGY